MTARNCTQCGQLFANTVGDICPVCYEQDFQACETVFAWLRQNGSQASVGEIAASTGIEQKKIMEMVKRGWLRGEFAVSYPCEQCGQLIREGRLCSECIKFIRCEMEKIGWWSLGRKDSDSGRQTKAQSQRTRFHSAHVKDNKNKR